MVLRGERGSDAPDLLDNLEAWYEHQYDTRLLHRNLAFPLLKKLVEVGDPLAKKVFKEEIKYRLKRANATVLKYLKNELLIPFYANEMTYLKREDISNEDVMEMLRSGNVFLINYLTDTGFIKSLSREQFYESIFANDKQRNKIIKTMKNLEVNLGNDLEIILLFDYMVTGFYLEERRITKLSIFEKPFNIPNSLGNLKSLKSLYLVSDEIEFLPGSLKDLVSLEDINLASNNLKNFPKSLMNLKNLRRCNLSFNQIQNLPFEIGELKNLEYLDLAGNQIYSIPDSIMNLNQLEFLDISENRFSQIPKTLKNLNDKITIRY